MADSSAKAKKARPVPSDSSDFPGYGRQASVLALAIWKAVRLRDDLMDYAQIFPGDPAALT